MRSLGINEEGGGNWLTQVYLEKPLKQCVSVCACACACVFVRTQMRMISVLFTLGYWHQKADERYGKPPPR